MHDSNIRATGVIRQNKLAKCSIKGPKVLEKKDRGYYDQRTAKNGTITVVGWHDNRSVYVALNALCARPTSLVSRWCRKAGSRVNIEQPGLIKQYNEHMGGVDRCDQNISLYRIGVKSRKWWWPLFIWIPDVIMQNCWLFYRYHFICFIAADFLHLPIILHCLAEVIRKIKPVNIIHTDSQYWYAVKVVCRFVGI